MISFLRALGFEFHIDYDCELLIEKPDEVSVDDVLEALGAWRENWRGILARQVKYEGQCERREFCGGPLHGQRHSVDYHLMYHHFRGYHLARAKWAVYEFQPDGRAFFRGYATSERKARDGRFVRSSNANAKD